METLRRTSKSRVDEVFYFVMFFYTAYHFAFLLSAKKNVFATSNASNVGFIVCILLQFSATTFQIGLSMIIFYVYKTKMTLCNLEQKVVHRCLLIIMSYRV